MKTRILLAALACTLLVQLPIAAGDLNWTFQRTGFRNSFSMVQTALSMRSDQTWPVVYAVDNGLLQAYSLFSVPNPGPMPISGPPTNWHRIGANLTQGSVSFGPLFLQADSGSPDGFGVSLQYLSSSTFPVDLVVTGNSFAGFQSPVVGAQALKYDAAGNPLLANAATIPGLPSGHKIFDIAQSAHGDFAAITQLGSGSGPVTYWQKSSLLGGNWLSHSLTPPTGESAFYAPSADVVFDTGSRPHVIGLNRTSSNSIIAHRFDVISGAWIASTLDTLLDGPPIGDVAAAANEQGIVGAAWVNAGTLKYAYLDTNETTPQWAVTTVLASAPTTAGTQLELSQGVGLAFDKAGLPVISFVERNNRQIWIAYDPPVVPEPSALALAGVALLIGMGTRRRWR